MNEMVHLRDLMGDQPSWKALSQAKAFLGDNWDHPEYKVLEDYVRHHIQEWKPFLVPSEPLGEEDGKVEKMFQSRLRVREGEHALLSWAWTGPAGLEPSLGPPQFFQGSCYYIDGVGYIARSNGTVEAIIQELRGLRPQQKRVHERACTFVMNWTYGTPVYQLWTVGRDTFSKVHRLWLTGECSDDLVASCDVERFQRLTLQPRPGSHRLLNFLHENPEAGVNLQKQIAWCVKNVDRILGQRYDTPEQIQLLIQRLVDIGFPEAGQVSLSSYIQSREALDTTSSYAQV